MEILRNWRFDPTYDETGLLDTGKYIYICETLIGNFAYDSREDHMFLIKKKIQIDEDGNPRYSITSTQFQDINSFGEADSKVLALLNNTILTHE
jgi:hypothetical protein